MTGNTLATPWLSKDQQQVWRTFLDGFARIKQELDDELRPFGLDLSVYEILLRLSESAERSMRMSDLAIAARQSRSRLTHSITRMEDKGLVRRLPCPDDRRGVIAQLTEEGNALLQEATPTHVERVRTVLVDAVEPNDLEALGRAMDAVVKVTN
ncbi:MAG: MarR family winged helix-turn-helix transcriptional regulator [Propioniciclava sp.]